MAAALLFASDAPVEGTVATSASPENFEKLMARLEAIVSEMERAELPLEKLLSAYEEGMRLVKACGERLADAEQKVEILSRSLAAEVGKPAAATSDAVVDGAPEAPGEDIRLF